MHEQEALHAQTPNHLPHRRGRGAGRRRRRCLSRLTPEIPENKARRVFPVKWLPPNRHFCTSPHSTFVGVKRSQVVCTVTLGSDVLVTTEQEVRLPTCQRATLSDGVVVHESAHRLLLCSCSCLGSLPRRRCSLACYAASRPCSDARQHAEGRASSTHREAERSCPERV